MLPMRVEYIPFVLWSLCIGLFVGRARAGYQESTVPVVGGATVVTVEHGHVYDLENIYDRVDIIQRRPVKRKRHVKAAYAIVEALAEAQDECIVEPSAKIYGFQFIYVETQVKVKGTVPQPEFEAMHALLTCDSCSCAI